MRIAAVAVLCVACGRIDFDPRAPGDATQGTDGAAPPCTPFDRTVPAPVFGAIGFTWAGDGYVIFNLDGLATISTTGDLGTFHQLSPAPIGWLPGQNAIAWTGSELGVVWSASAGYFARYDPQLAPIGTPMTVEAGGMEQRVVWTGAGFAVAGHSLSNNTTLAELTASGSLVGGQQIDTAAIKAIYAVEATNDHYIVAAIDSSNARIAIAWPRPLAGGATRVTLPQSGIANYPQLARTPTGVVALEGGGADSANPGSLVELSSAGDLVSNPIPLPVDRGQSAGYATAVPIAIGVRVALVTSGNPAFVYIADYDTTSHAFGAVTELGQFSSSSYAAPVVARAPGAVLIAQTYTDLASANQLRLIQTCVD